MLHFHYRKSYAGNHLQEEAPMLHYFVQETLYRKSFIGSGSKSQRGRFMNQLKQIRESLGVSQEGLARRTRSITTRTVRNAEDGKRVTNDTATQILEAINALLTENSRSTITLNDLGLTLY